MKNIDFVGTLTGSTCDTTFDENNEGHVCVPTDPGTLMLTNPERI